MVIAATLTPPAAESARNDPHLLWQNGIRFDHPGASR